MKSIFFTYYMLLYVITYVFNDHWFNLFRLIKQLLSLKDLYTTDFTTLDSA